VFSWVISGIGLDGPACVEWHRVFPGRPVAGLMVDRDGVAVVDMALTTDLVATEGLARSRTSPCLSAIVLGPLMMICYIEAQR